MATIGNLVIDITGNMSGLKKTLGSARKSVGGFGKAAFGALGGAAVAGTAIAGAAVAGLTIAGTNAFIDFQNSMNEVFTLLPGMSQSAMDDMSAQALQFSKDLGILPNDVVPALYQAISAGVPPGNVFDFLETSQKAAVGGVTDLTTAIDGITSVVNAYGDEVINETEASDLMFTAVKKGKTTFGELSQSLFNVIPTASALKVGFGDITAAMATMTAQGTPTSVATTQMRQLLVELSKSGTKTSAAFKEAAGVGFAEFIAQGGNVQGALQIMQGAADANGLSLQDMFGSVEAGNAALALTGANADTFTANLQAMQDSAGATQAAYEQMDSGIKRSFDKIKASGAAMLVQLGEGISPLVEKFATGLQPAMEKFGAWFTETGGPAIADFAEKAGKWIDEFMARARPIWDEFSAKLNANVGPALAMIKDAIDRMKQAFGLADKDVSGMDIILAGLKTTLDAVVIGVQAVGVAFQGIAWIAEQIRSAWDAAKGLYNQISQLISILNSGDFNLLGGIAGGLGINIPGFADGGIVPGTMGSPQLILAHGGETVLPTHRGGTVGNTVNITINANNASDAQNGVMRALRAAGMA